MSSQRITYQAFGGDFGENQIERWRQNTRFLLNSAARKMLKVEVMLAYKRSAKRKADTKWGKLLFCTSFLLN